MAGGGICRNECPPGVLGRDGIQSPDREATARGGESPLRGGGGCGSHALSGRGGEGSGYSAGGAVKSSDLLRRRHGLMIYAGKAGCGWWETTRETVSDGQQPWSGGIRLTRWLNCAMSRSLA